MRVVYKNGKTIFLIKIKIIVLNKYVRPGAVRKYLFCWSSLQHCTEKDCEIFTAQTGTDSRTSRTLGNLYGGRLPRNFYLQLFRIFFLPLCHIVVNFFSSNHTKLSSKLSSINKIFWENLVVMHLLVRLSGISLINSIKIITWMQWLIATFMIKRRVGRIWFKIIWQSICCVLQIIINLESA